MISKFLRIVITLAAIGAAAAVILASSEMNSLLPDKYNIINAAAQQRVREAAPQTAPLEVVDSLTIVDSLPQIDSLVITADSLPKATDETIIE